MIEQQEDFLYGKFLNKLNRFLKKNQNKIDPLIPFV